MDHDHRSARDLAQGLGWLSLGLGLAGLLGSRRVADGLGVPEQAGMVQAAGARELITGIGILAARDPAPWLWGRVAGDALDLAALAAAVPDNPRKGNALLALAAVAGITVLDVSCAQALARDRRHPARPQYDYSGRSGLPLGLARSRGVASDLEIPRDMRIPEALRPWRQAPAVPKLRPQLSSTQTVAAAAHVQDGADRPGAKAACSGGTTVRTCRLRLRLRMPLRRKLPMPRSRPLPATLHQDSETLARNLGWLSVGLGLATFLAPRPVARGLGMADQTALVRAYGVREITTGLGMLTGRERAPWLTARLGGDLLDLAALAPGLAPRNRQRGNVLLAMALVVGVSLLDLTCARAAIVTEQPARGWRARSRRLADRLQRRVGRPQLPGLPARLRGLLAR